MWHTTHEQRERVRTGNTGIPKSASRRRRSLAPAFSCVLALSQLPLMCRWVRTTVHTFGDVLEGMLGTLPAPSPLRAHSKWQRVGSRGCAAVLHCVTVTPYTVRCTRTCSRMYGAPQNGEEASAMWVHVVRCPRARSQLSPAGPRLPMILPG